MSFLPNSPAAWPYDLAAWILTGMALLLLLPLHLLPALLAGLLVYELVHLLAPRLHVIRVRQAQGKLVAVALLATVIVIAVTVAIIASIAFFHSEAGNVPLLLQKMADILDGWRATLPDSVVEQFPVDPDELKEFVVEGLRNHAGALQRLGTEVGHILVHVLVGLVIGSLVALHDVQPLESPGPLARALQERAVRLSEAFRRIVFAQLRISLLNTALTALYLLVILPVMGVHLPLTKTMIAVTFVVGLLPVVGNLLSNGIIVVVSLSVSLTVAVMSLVFLMVIHKLEYFLNAHIVGTQIHARAWELLLAMLVMEAVFGLVGVIAAPIYYAYLKDELVRQGVV